MNRRRQGLSPTLFPFLAVLVCTLGTLILLLALVAQDARDSAQEAADADAETARQMADLAQFEAEELIAFRQRQTETLEQRRGELAHLEDHLRRLREELSQLKRQTETADASEDTAEQAAARTARLEELDAKIAAAREAIEVQRAEQEGRPPRVVIVPHKGVNGTDRRPIYVECTDQAIVLQPEGVRITADQLGGSLGPGNPVDAALRAIRNHWQKIDPEAPAPYPLLLVRPDGVHAYAAARVAMDAWDDQFGYELIPAEMELEFPNPDFELKETLIATVADAARRSRSLAVGGPPRFNRYSPGSGRAPGGQLGAVAGNVAGADNAAGDGDAMGAGYAAGDDLPERIPGNNGPSGNNPLGSPNGTPQNGYAQGNYQGVDPAGVVAGGGGPLAQNPAYSGTHGSPNAEFGGTGSLSGNSANIAAAAPGQLPSGNDLARAGEFSEPGDFPQLAGENYNAPPAVLADTPFASNSGNGSVRGSSTGGPSKFGPATDNPNTGSPPGSAAKPLAGAIAGGSGSDPGDASAPTQNAGSDGTSAKSGSPNGSGSQDQTGPSNPLANQDGTLAQGSVAGMGAGSGAASPPQGQVSMSNQAGAAGYASSASAATPPRTFSEAVEQRAQMPNRPPPRNRPSRMPSLSSANNWALPEAMRSQRGPTMVRELPLDCAADRFVLRPHHDAPAITVPIRNGLVDQAVTELAVKLRDTVAEWGPAMRGGRWAPVLSVRVLPGGEPRFQHLEMLMRGSGFRVERRTQ